MQEGKKTLNDFYTYSAFESSENSLDFAKNGPPSSWRFNFKYQLNPTKDQGSDGQSPGHGFDG